jgi:hypothetical protein
MKIVHSWEGKCCTMMTKYQQQHRQHMLQEHNTGTSEGDNVGGHATPPRDRPSGGARGGARARKNTKGW